MNLYETVDLCLLDDTLLTCVCSVMIRRREEHTADAIKTIFCKPFSTNFWNVASEEEGL